MADCDVEGGAGQQPGRIQNRQGRSIGRRQERDLGAYQAHRIKVLHDSSASSFAVSMSGPAAYR
jgi:hypothetical protein